MKWRISKSAPRILTSTLENIQKTVQICCHVPSWNRSLMQCKKTVLRKRRRLILWAFDRTSLVSGFIMYLSNLPLMLFTRGSNLPVNFNQRSNNSGWDFRDIIWTFTLHEIWSRVCFLYANWIKVISSKIDELAVVTVEIKVEYINLYNFDKQDSFKTEVF